jgi:membrane complex biogenesis BtpA family protein
MRAMKPLLGVVHLRALPSAARHVSMDEVFSWAFADAAALAKGGVTGICVENFGDAPFRKGTKDDPVTPDVVAALAVVAREVSERHGLPVMVNCLRNDGIAALGAAAVIGAKWVRVNVIAGAYVTDQGVIEGEAARLFAYRRQLGVSTHVMADFLVKHATPLAPFDEHAAARDLAERSGAAGLILSGSRTGEPVDAARIDAVRKAVGDFPIWLGSGLSAANAAELWPRCDGAIVGTALKRDGDVAQRVDAARVKKLVAALRSAEGRRAR